MKKIISLLTLSMLVLTSCGNEKYWVLDKNKISELPKVENYINQLQQDKADYEGYNVITISEGKKAVVISSGEEGKNLEFVEVHTSSKDTAITVKETDERSQVTNPYIVVGLDEIKGAFYVYNQKKEEYDGSGYYKE